MKIAVFDVGGTFIKYAISDQEGHLTHKGKVATPDTKAGFQTCIQSCIQDMGVIEGYSFSLPGFVDSEQGYISLGGSLRYHDNCRFVQEMENLLQLPVIIQNDAKCAALSEIWKGNAGNYHNAMVLVFGTGVGGAFIQDQQVYLGSHFMSSELSCIITGDITKEGFQATLGNTFSIPNLMARIAKRCGIAQLSGQTAFQMAEEGNPIVLEELTVFYRSFAVQLFNLQCCYDPDVFFIGGGISEQPAFIQGLREAAKAFLAQISLPLPPIDIQSTTHKADANLIGAVYQYKQRRGLE